MPVSDPEWIGVHEITAVEGWAGRADAEREIASAPGRTVRAVLVPAHVNLPKAEARTARSRSCGPDLPWSRSIVR